MRKSKDVKILRCENPKCQNPKRGKILKYQNLKGLDMLICAGRNEFIKYATPIGVGLVEASIGLTRLCLRESIEKLTFIGTAGAYSYDLPLLSLCASKQATQIESGFLSGECYTPLENCIAIENQAVSRETLESISEVLVNSSNYITTNPNISNKMTSAGILLENMEFFAVLRVAQEFNIPTLGVFCITNYCNENAHRDFLLNHAKAKAKLEEYIDGKKYL
ncbi:MULTISPECIES: phosphorylase family protein [unclassified Helicobacter]|uniref:phosphorylase family protein n=1 Tax=unclassified Helicobacter TaxID=2593540 RepID=UPI002D76538F|nr:purine-nucleoside phosphorylase [Helicobacter sp. 'CLO3_human']